MNTETKLAIEELAEKLKRDFRDEMSQAVLKIAGPHSEVFQRLASVEQDVARALRASPPLSKPAELNESESLSEVNEKLHSLLEAYQDASAQQLAYYVRCRFEIHYSLVDDTVPRSEVDEMRRKLSEIRSRLSTPDIVLVNYIDQLLTLSREAQKNENLIRRICEIVERKEKEIAKLSADLLENTALQNYDLAKLMAAEGFMGISSLVKGLR